MVIDLGVRLSLPPVLCDKNDSIRVQYNTLVKIGITEL